MFNSIRWRLVASYVLLTVLTVSVLGVLALSFVESYATQQELASLTANAEAVARQAGPLVRPGSGASQVVLRDLARTAAFLGNARVRILDTRQQVVTDPGPRTAIEDIWLVQPTSDASGNLDAFEQALLLALPNRPPTGSPAGRGPGGPPAGVPPFFRNYGADVTVIRRAEGPWGSRLTFERGPGPTNGGQPRGSSPPPTADTSRNQTADVPAGDRVVLVPMMVGNDTVGYVELSRSADYVAGALEATRRAFGWAALAAAALAVVVGLFVSQGLTAPLSRLALAANRMRGGDLSARAPVGGSGEIRQLTQQFNTMAEGLEASFGALAAERDTLRRFIADASHELRTPITALKTYNELLQGSAGDEPATRAEFLSESQAQVDRLTWITQNLLDLSRLDAGLTPLALAPHDAGEIVESVAARFRTLAQTRGLTLTTALPTVPLVVRCDRPRIEMALSNLVDNALKFTPRGGHVRLGVDQIEEGVRFWVADTGPGIDPADQPHLFERFYRGRSATAQGSGLGLAIVASIAHAHSGRVWVDSRPGHGTAFSLLLPP